MKKLLLISLSLTILAGAGYALISNLSQVKSDPQASSKSSQSDIEAPVYTDQNTRAESTASVAPTTKTSKTAIFLHHSTGQNIWDGGVETYFSSYNALNQTNYQIEELAFPSDEYGWENYPYDYWNIWVNQADQEYYLGQPTLDTLTQNYDIIILKHCFPVGYIEEDEGSGSVSSSAKTLDNYQLQYQALKTKFQAYPDTSFIVWTGAALIESETDEIQAARMREFVDWIKSTWDEPGDNIYIFDFYQLETLDELYLKSAYSAGDSHPNETFSTMVAPLFAQAIIDVMQGIAE